MKQHIYFKYNHWIFVCIYIFSPFEIASQQSVIRKLKRMETSDDDDDDSIISVSRHCRPVLEHKLVSYLFVIPFLVFKKNHLNSCEEHLWLFTVIFY